MCPLCKARFKSIIHTIQSDNVYESYTLPPPPAANSDNPARQEMALVIFTFSNQTSIIPDKPKNYYTISILLGYKIFF